MTATELPSCPVCCETLGRYGGPATLPCGHNGCLDCFALVQHRNAQCPLCRQPFDRGARLSCNYELQDLIRLATSMFDMDETSQKEGWEAFPTHKLAAESYASELVQNHSAAAGGQAAGLPPDYHAAAAMPPAASGTWGNSSQLGSYSGYPDPMDLQAWPSAPLLHEPTQGADAGPSNGGMLSPAAWHSALPGHAHGHSHVHGHAHSGSEVLSLEPPLWLPDSHASECLSCHLPFRPFTRLRHHCRLCGKIFCHACCHKQALLPPKYGLRTPQRVCELCAIALSPHQQHLAGTLAAAAQPPVQDAPDAISLRAWLNAPWSNSLEDDVFKAANMLQTFVKAARMQPELGLPTAVLQGAVGLVLLSVVKVGAGWSVSFGTGLLVARMPDSSWSAPCAVGAGGVGWGLQLGGELVDVLLVLRSREALAGLCGGLRSGLGLGGNAAVALGPLGRHADATMLVGTSGTTAAYSYSCSKGAFVGVSLESSMLYVRDQVNYNFYGYAVTPRELLLDGVVAQPPAAALLYNSLQAVTDKFENRRLFTHPPHGSVQRRLSTGSIASVLGASQAATPLVGSRVISSRSAAAAVGTSPILE